MFNISRIFVFFLSASIMLGAYCSLYVYQISSPVKAEWWLKEAIIKKTDLLSKIESPQRVIIISGSNSLFGFKSSTLQEGLGVPVFNFGLHASLDMSYITMIAKRITKKGDVFIAPLEYSFYIRENEYSEWFINNMLAWGEDYISKMNPVKFLTLISHTDANRVFDGLVTQPRQVLAQNKDILRFVPKGDYRGYNYKSIMSNGDIITPDSQTDYVKNLQVDPDSSKDTLSYQSWKKPESYSTEQIIKLKKSIESSGGKLVVIWPVSMKTKYFNEQNSNSNKFIKSISKNMQKAGVKIHCQPYEFNLSQEYFFDTYYHLNNSGEELRSKKVIECIKREGIITNGFNS